MANFIPQLIDIDSIIHQSIDVNSNHEISWIIYSVVTALREKCLNTEFFLVRIYPYSDYSKLRTEKNSVFGHFTQCKTSIISNIPTGIYLLKVNYRNTRKMYEIYWKLTIKTLQRRHRRRSGVFIVNFELILHIVLVFLLFTLIKQMPAGISTEWSSSRRHLCMKRKHIWPEHFV